MENKASEPDFWNDPEKSQAVLKHLKQLKTKLGRFQQLESKYEEIELMIMIGNEENDASMAEKVREELEDYKKAFNTMQTTRFLRSIPAREARSRRIGRRCSSECI